MRDMRRPYATLLALLVLAASMMLSAGCTREIVENRMLRHMYVLRASCSPDGKTVWAVGTKGTILFYDGRRWSRYHSPTAMTMRSVCATGPRDVWAVGDTGIVVHFDGRTWRKVEAGTCCNLLGVSAAAPDRVWVVGASGTVLTYDGLHWQAQNPVTWSFTSVSATSRSTAWLAGDGGILYYDGSFHRSFSSPVPISSIMSAGDGKAWAVGADGQTNPISVSTIFHFDGTWQSVYQVPDCILKGVFSSGNKTWAVGASGVVVSFDGSGWTRRSVGMYDTLYSVSVLGDGESWVVGNRIGTKWVDFPLVRKIAKAGGKPADEMVMIAERGTKPGTR